MFSGRHVVRQMATKHQLVGSYFPNFGGSAGVFFRSHSHIKSEATLPPRLGESKEKGGVSAQGGKLPGGRGRGGGSGDDAYHAGGSRDRECRARVNGGRRRGRRADAAGPQSRGELEAQLRSARSPHRMLELLEAIHVQGHPRRMTAQPYTNALDKFARMGPAKIEMVLGVLETMRAHGVTPTAYTYNVAASACVKARQYEHACWLLEVMRQQGVAPDTITYNIMIKAARIRGMWKHALSLLGEMKTDGLQPDVVTLNTILSALGNSGQWERAIEFHRREFRADSTGGGMRPDVVTYNTLISACAKAKRWDLAIEYLDELLATPELQPTVISFNSAMSALGNDGKWERARQLLHSMPVYGVIPDDISYSAAIRACGRASNWQGAMELLDELCSNLDTHPASNVPFNCAITALAGGGQWQQAVGLLERMHRQQDQHPAVAPDLISYNAAIQSTRGEQQWEVALGLLEQMLGRGITPDSISYNTAMAVCAKSGQWEEALRLFEFMSAQVGKGGGGHGRLCVPNSTVAAVPAPDASSFGTIIEALDGAEQMDKAVAIYQQAAKAGVYTHYGLLGVVGDEMGGAREGYGPMRRSFEDVLEQHLVRSLRLGGEIDATEIAVEVAEMVEDGESEEGITEDADLYGGGKGGGQYRKGEVRRAVIDLHGCNAAVARVALYSIFCSISEMAAEHPSRLFDLEVVTGYGKNQGATRKPPVLANAARKFLRMSFDPPIRTEVITGNRGAFIIPAGSIKAWAAAGCQWVKDGENDGG